MRWCYAEKSHAELEPTTCEKVYGKVSKWGERHRGIVVTGDGRSGAGSLARSDLLDPGGTPVNWTPPAPCVMTRPPRLDGPRTVCRPLRREGINGRYAGSDKVIDIARDESKSPYLGRCGQQALDEGQGIGNTQHRPRICNRLVDGKHAVAEAPSRLPAYEPTRGGATPMRTGSLGAG